MVYEVVIKPKAELDLTEALDWYKQQQEGLELKLYSEISGVLDKISLNPKHFQKKYREVRICFTAKFSYGIHYTLEKNKVFVHAILHTSRKPLK